MSPHLPYAYGDDDEFRHPCGDWYLLDRAITHDSWLTWRHALPEGRQLRNRLPLAVSEAITALALRLDDLHQRLPGYRHPLGLPFVVPAGGTRRPPMRTGAAAAAACCASRASAASNCSAPSPTLARSPGPPCRSPSNSWSFASLKKPLSGQLYLLTALQRLGAGPEDAGALLIEDPAPLLTLRSPRHVRVPPPTDRAARRIAPHGPR
jgi:hypothetical protein